MAKKNKLNFNTALLLGILALLIYGFSNGWFSSVYNIDNNFDTNLFSNPIDGTEGECSLDIEPNRVCLGEEITGTAKDGANTNSYLFVNDGTGWRALAGAVTDNNGNWIETTTIGVVGDFDFLVIFDKNDNLVYDEEDCITNVENLIVEVCPGDEGDNTAYTCGWTGNQCGGTCPDDYPLCVDMWYEPNILQIGSGYTFCGCVDPDTEELHPEWKPDGDNHEPIEEQPQLTNCEDVVLPAYGDLGGICREEGNCLTDNCEHYWNYNDQEHKCGCTETTFCGQYCFEYLYTSDCECPPGSFKEITSKSTYQCIPDNHFCENGNVVPDVGPFPE